MGWLQWYFNLWMGRHLYALVTLARRMLEKLINLSCSSSMDIKPLLNFQLLHNEIKRWCGNFYWNTHSSHLERKAGLSLKTLDIILFLALLLFIRLKLRHKIACITTTEFKITKWEHKRRERQQENERTKWMNEWRWVGSKRRSEENIFLLTSAVF